MGKEELRVIDWAPPPLSSLNSAECALGASSLAFFLPRKNSSCFLVTFRNKVALRAAIKKVLIYRAED